MFHMVLYDLYQGGVGVPGWKLVGLLLGLVLVMGMMTSWMRTVPAVKANPDPQEMFVAVERWLKQAGVQPQDMPKKVVTVTPHGRETYLVHMEMVQGNAWFELRWTGEDWQIRGVNPPRE